ncbi:sigma 54-interacting transcriptional regulator [bacterium]|nr:sigma 54-interacting transcriptional regulator [bacterium]
MTADGERLSTEERALLYDLGRAINEFVDLDRLLPEIVTRLRSLFGIESSAVMLLDAARSEFYVPYVADIAPAVERRLAAVRFPADRGIAGAVLHSGDVAHVPDVSRDPRWYGAVDGRTGMTTRSLLCAPLRGRAGTLGVLSLRNKVRGTFSDDDLRLIRAVADHIGLAIDTARQLGEARGTAERLRDEVEVLQQQVARDAGVHGIVGHSTAMQRVFELIASAAALPVTVLITGETGVGKELIARAIHAGGPRRARPFVAINCGALSDTLLESELFGHRKGAFTGALSDRKGLFEVADGGTVFLDEVGDMPAAMQVKLLRALQEGEILPVGDTTPRSVDVRVLSATNRDLAAGVRDGGFRADLFYRLSAFPIVVPPLRERREDIPLLTARLLERTLKRFERPATQFSPAALVRLSNHDWPGNVRELQNEIERAIALAAPGAVIDAADLSEHVRGASVVAPPTVAAGGITLRRARDLFERDFIARVLSQQGGNASRAARVLGISRVMLHKKLRAYGMRRIDLVRVSA